MAAGERGEVRIGDVLRFLYDAVEMSEESDPNQREVLLHKLGEKARSEGYVRNPTAPEEPEPQG